MVNFTVVIYGEKAAAERLEGIASNAANTRPAMEEIYLTILDINQEAFDNEGARSGFPRWQKLAIDTVIWKAKRRLDPRILHAYGYLRAAMTTYRHPDAYVRIEREKIIFMPRLAKIPYGRVQYKGGRAGGVEIPARPYMRFSRSDSQAFGRELMRHVTRRRGPGRIGISFGG